MRLSLLVKTVLTLATTGLLPLTISFYQLRVNKDALLEQLQTTHSVAARTTAARVDAVLSPYLALAQTVAQTTVHQGVRSEAMQELLYGTLQTQDIGLLIWNSEGEELIRAQRSGVWEDLELRHQPEAPLVSTVQGKANRWLRFVLPLAGNAGQVAVVTSTKEVVRSVQAHEIGEEADLVLAALTGKVILGSGKDLEAFPPRSVKLALSGKVHTGSEKYQGAQADEDIVVAFAKLERAPWVVLSRQPARKAEIAQRQIKSASWFAAASSLVLTTALSWLAFVSVIRPLRRLIRAQQDLVGGELSLAEEGSEIAQLEAAFKILEERIRTDEDLGQIFLGRYQVKEVLGSGAMGTVFRGWDPKLERDLALKTIKLESAEFKRNKLVSTLLREAKTSAGFNHPNIVTVYDAADQGKAAFIAMELVEGISLEEMISAQGRLEWTQAVPLGAAIARGLTAAHDRQLVHQDIKPANILLGRDSSIKVTDFGISQAISSASAAEGVICGTPGYIAPECLEGQGYTKKSDLFALGVLLYESLTGKHPFGGNTLRLTIVNTINYSPPPLTPHHPGIPLTFEQTIFQLLEKDPRLRPENAEEVAERFEKLAFEHQLNWRFHIRASRTGQKHQPKSSLRTQVLSLRETRALALTTRESQRATSLS